MHVFENIKIEKSTCNTLKMSETSEVSIEISENTSFDTVSTENTPSEITSQQTPPRHQSLLSKEAKIWFSLRAYDVNTGKRNTASRLVKNWNSTGQKQYDHKNRNIRKAVFRTITNQEKTGTVLTKTECKVKSKTSR